MKKRYKASVRDIFESVLEILEALNINIDNIDGKKRIINASTGLSWRSWGEMIHIRVVSVEEEVEVQIESSPKTQLIDWGKSKKNVEAIFRRLDRSF